MKRMEEIDFQGYPLWVVKPLELLESWHGKQQKLLKRQQVSRYLEEKSIKVKEKPIENKEVENI